MNRLLTLFLACSSLALAAGNLNIIVGGQAAPDPAITVGGRWFGGDTGLMASGTVRSEPARYARPLAPVG